MYVGMRHRGRRRARGAKPAGSVLLETLLALVILCVAGLAVIALLQRALIATFKAREEMTCSRLADSGINRLKNMDFYNVFPADSARADYGGLHPSYPYMAVLDGIKAMLASAKFDRFTTSVVYMRRDSSDANHNGMTDDLIAFQDDGHGCDVNAPSLCFYDQNGDGDFYETFSSGTRLVSETPDTHLKQVTLSVYRRNRLVCSRTSLLSLEQFSGQIDPDSEALLSLLVSTPSNGAYLYSTDSPGLAGAQALPISSAYPVSVARLEADGSRALALAGQTEPLASVTFSVNGGAILAAVPADVTGAFGDAPAAVTAALVEGENILQAQAVKGSLTSPLAQQQVLLDLAAPSISAPTPVGAAATYAPYVAATLLDPGVSTTTTSGVCPDVTVMELDGSTVPFRYDAVSGLAVALDSSTGSAPVLSSGTHTAYVETGDYAGYKTTATWTFTVAVPDVDNSAPSVSNKSPIGTASSSLPAISVRVFDNQSGIVPSSIVLTFDGATVVDASSVGAAYDPATGTVSWTPPAPLAAGSFHTVGIAVSHWASSPADKVTATDSWGFSVP